MKFTTSTFVKLCFWFSALLVAWYFLMASAHAQVTTVDGLIALDNGNVETKAAALGYVAATRDAHMFWLTGGESEEVIIDVLNGRDTCAPRGAWAVATIIATMKQHLTTDESLKDMTVYVWYRDRYAPLVCPEMLTPFID